MSDSSLVSVKQISPNKSERAYRNSASTGKISKITIHHMAGKMSASGCLDWFARSSTKASSNYVIGYDGTIGLSVPESYRSWCSSNGDNDNIAITIECSNTGSNDSNWPVSDTVLEKCIVLCWDICKRNGIEKLVYTGKKDGNLTRHDMFIDKVCPGPYLGGKFPYIVEQVNSRLNDIYYRPLCKKGDKNDFVKELQTLLINLGYDLGSYGADGDFGSCTYAAVKKYQTDKGLSVNGECNQDVWNLLLNKKEEVVEAVEGKKYDTCTAAQAIKEMEYFIGYYEKASNSYASTDDKDVFEKNKGSNNYTYAGYVCGIQGQMWCAAQVSTAIWKACGKDKEKAKEAMFGIWPYIACNQLWDAAPSGHKFWSYHQRFTLGKGERKDYPPIPGDVIIFTNNNTTRVHTGLVYKVDSKYVYTIEGNSNNMCQRRSYLLTSSYIYGYVRPLYSDSQVDDVPGELYGQEISQYPELHYLSKGNAGPEVEALQLLLNHKAEQGVFKLEESLEVDGDFGTATEVALIAFKDTMWPDYAPNNGIAGAGTWDKLIN